MAVAVDQAFFAEFPVLPEVDASDADMAWFIYELREREQGGRYHLTHARTVYTQFTPALQRITNPSPGPEESFRTLLQKKLNEKHIVTSQPPGISAVADMLNENKSAGMDEE